MKQRKCDKDDGVGIGYLYECVKGMIIIMLFE